ncbi:MAG: hypothetical protein AAFW75_01250 [Cyanobacteria bacterium J06636_16]
MNLITNSKLSGIQPCWADFRGFTLLFDNPGASLSQQGSLEYVTVDPNLLFYQVLNSTLQQFKAELTGHYLFFALAPHSYHVTACDGGNVDNLACVKATHRDALKDFLEDLPESIGQANSFAECVNKSELLAKRDWKIRLEFDSLANWSDVSIVACLRPTDTEAAEQLDQFTEARRQLCTALQTSFAINPSATFVPHVTLGYFANCEYGQRTRSQIDKWQAVFSQAMANLSISFSSISLYGFTDMETFFRRSLRL